MKILYIATFPDVKGAFDNVNIDILLSKLAKIGRSSRFLSYIKFISHERFIYTERTGESNRLIHKGVPQGGIQGVFSPILHILYVADIVK